MLTMKTGAAPTPRDWKQAMLRGWRGRCPSCGEGRLFGRFLKVQPACASCGTELHHHRADDLPPYLTMAIVGHLVVWLILIAEIDFSLPLWVHLALWPLLTVGLSLWLIQPIKGAVVGLQWANRMHGFGGESEDEPVRPARATRALP